MTPIEWNKMLARALNGVCSARTARRHSLYVVVPLAIVWSAGVLAQPSDSSSSNDESTVREAGTAEASDASDQANPADQEPLIGSDERPIVIGEPASDSGPVGGSRAPDSQTAPDTSWATSTTGTIEDRNRTSDNDSRFANPAPRPLNRPPPAAAAPPDLNSTATSLGNLSGGGFSQDIGVVGGRGFGFAGGGGCAPSVGGGSVSGSASTSVLAPPSAPSQTTRNTIRASVTGSETFSDNINLTERNQRSDYVTSVAPRIDACSTAGRIRGEASYQLQGVVYANNSQYNDIYNDLKGSTTIDLIEQHLYLDANTTYGQQVIDPSFGYGRSNIIRPRDNQTTSWRTNISPYLMQSLGPVGTGVLRYRYGRAIYDDNDVPDSTVQSVYGSIASPDSVEPLSWQASVVSQWVTTSGGNRRAFIDNLNELLGDQVSADDFDTGNNKQRFDSATLQLGYRVLPHVQVTALGGAEDRYSGNGENDRFSSVRWQAGVRYADADTTLEANYGHRFYGASYALSASQSTALANFRLSYQEDPSSSGLDSLNGGGGTFGSVGSIDGMLGYGGGFGGTSTYGSSLYNRNVYISKRWNADVDFDTALTHTNLRGFVQDRKALVENVPDTHYHGVEVDTRYDFRPRISVVPSASWTHYQGDQLDVGASDRYETGVSVVRAVSPSAQAAVGYSHNWRDGSVEYHENRITLQFQKGF